MRFAAGDAFDREDVAAGYERERDETAVDRAVAAFAARVAVDDRDRARAAVAFRAALFRAGEAARPQPFELGDVGRDRFDPNGLPVQAKLDRAAHLTTASLQNLKKGTGANFLDR